jgi:excisionase family DNA binding protein
MTRLRTPRQLAAHTDISEKRIRELLKNGELRHLKMGAKFLIPDGALEEYFDRHMVEPISNAHGV